MITLTFGKAEECVQGHCQLEGRSRRKMLAFCFQVPPSHPATRRGPDRRLWARTGQEGNDLPLISKQSQNKPSNWLIQTLLAHKMYKHFLFLLKRSKNTYSFRYVLELASLPVGTIYNLSIVWKHECLIPLRSIMEGHTAELEGTEAV